MIYKRKVKSIIHHVFEDGYVRPILVLSKTFPVKKDFCNTIFLDSSHMIDKFKLKIGSTVMFSADEEAIDILKSYGGHTQMKDFKKCNFCKSEIAHDALADESYCTNNFCQGKSRSPILRLIDLALQDVHGAQGRKLLLRTFEAKLDKYPMRDGKVKVKDLITFLQLFSSLGEKNTATRFHHWKTVCSSEEAAMALHGMEVALQSYLRSGKVLNSSTSLWSVLNIPKVKSKNFALLSTNLTTLFFVHLKDFTLSRVEKQAIRKNSDYILRTTELLNSFLTP